MIYLLHGPCERAVPLDAFPAFDASMTDLPYSKHTHKNAVSCSARNSGASKSRGARARDFGFDHLTPSLRRYFAGCAARVRRWSLSYSDAEGATWLRFACESAGAEYIRTLPWTRWSMPQLAGDRPCQGWEPVLLFHAQDLGARGGRKPRLKTWNGPGWLTHLDHTCLRGDDKHPTGKPLDQALDLVHWFTDPGETVYDPCAGHATFGLACRILGRNYLGCEALQEHVERGRSRLAGRLEGTDADRLVRWRESMQARIVEAQRVLENDPESKQTARCLAAMQRDLGIAA